SVSVFFFQAEDGIRDWSVTGVQTCALPICDYRLDLRLTHRAVARAVSPTCGPAASLVEASEHVGQARVHGGLDSAPPPRSCSRRSEERRVGKECRSWWSTSRYKHKRDGRGG